MRIDFDPEAMGRNPFYKLLNAMVVPRPIAWVSTLSADGETANLAPHSYFTISCIAPPVVQFTSVGRKDSLRNAEATGEFVVNLAPEQLFDAINDTATDFPAHVGEFDAVGIEREPSLRVKPPRVAASPVALECVLHSTLRLGDSTVVFGRVVHAAISEDVLVDGHPEVMRLRPLSRLGKDEWGTLAEVVEKSRIPFGDWTGPTPDARTGEAAGGAG
jgi:flavin reductase (DIM6/NTAB) family NADH-FMN oxidoreductase RutF